MAKKRVHLTHDGGHTARCGTASDSMAPTMREVTCLRCERLHDSDMQGINCDCCSERVYHWSVWRDWIPGGSGTYRLCRTCGDANAELFDPNEYLVKHFRATDISPAGGGPPIPPNANDCDGCGNFVTEWAQWDDPKRFPPGLMYRCCRQCAEGRALPFPPNGYRLGSPVQMKLGV